MVITGLTRNQLGSNPPRVRISPSPPKNPSRKTWIFLSKLQAWYVITRLRVCNRRRRMSSPQVYFLQLDDIQHFVLLTFRLTTDYMHGFAVILSQCRTYCHRTCFLAFTVDMAINICRCSHIAVTKPVLNHFHRHAVCGTNNKLRENSPSSLLIFGNILIKG